MKASALEFRLRLLSNTVVVVLGFLAPWNYLLHLDHTRSLWLPAAIAIAHTGWLSLTGASNALLGAAILLVLLAAGLRTWAAAYLSVRVVKDVALQGSTLVADGPYRYVRNPLYLGAWLHVFALGLLMPPSGAVFAVLLSGVLQLRLIGAEEAFLAQTLGDAYLAYLQLVPRLLPAWRPRVPASGAQPAWGSALLGEIYLWGVVVAFVSVGWRYNALWVTQGVLIAFGVSLVVGAFLPRPTAAQAQTQAV
jgi:protein-S-isoprenylcysteine O-methyltransferase Ste14